MKAPQNMKHDEPAFPMFSGQPGDFHTQYGITVREYFAAKAMQGLISKYEFPGSQTENIAELSVKQADALIAALNSKQE